VTTYERMRSAGRSNGYSAALTAQAASWEEE
jgi:hypothetical protein